MFNKVKRINSDIAQLLNGDVEPTLIEARKVRVIFGCLTFCTQILTVNLSL